MLLCLMLPSHFLVTDLLAYSATPASEFLRVWVPSPTSGQEKLEIKKIYFNFPELLET